jgi:hypothetical protein
VKAVGRYTVGPGRFDTQALTIHGYGKPATTNQSQKAHFQYALFEPSNPSNPVYGELNILPGNMLQSGSNLILEMQGPTGTEVNGLPTRLYWFRSVSSGTAYTGTGVALPAYNNFPTNYFNSQGAPASPQPGSPGGPDPTSVANWSMGFGTVTFSYVPDAHPQPGTLASGKVVVVARGLLNTSGAQGSINQKYN